MADTIKISIPGKMEYVQSVKMMAGSIAASAGFDIESVDDIKIAVEEGIKNVTCHGSTKLSSECIIEIDVSDEGIGFTIEDMCSEHDIAKGDKPCLDCPHEGNLATSILRTIMDQVETSRAEHAGKRIHMVKKYAR